MKIKIDKLEHILKCNIKKRFSCIGLDTAQRTGIAFIKTSDKYVTFDWMFLEFKDAGNNKEIYKTMVKTFENILNDNNFAVIEEVFVGFSPAGSIELARYGSFAIAECIKKNIDYNLISAKCCRGKFGINTSKKAGYGPGKSKQAVADWIKQKLEIELEDEDISDAIILALLGIIKDMDFIAVSKGGKQLKK